MRSCYLPALIALAACGSRTPDVPSNEVSSSDAVVVEQAPSNSLSRSDTPPADFEMPQFAPRYPGSTLVAVTSALVGGEQNNEVRLTTADDAGKIMDFYRSSFAAFDMRKTSDFLSGGTGMMSGLGKNRKVSIAITREEDHQMIIVTYSGK
ncbi:hypothetical protein [Sphingobium yanoikuyae]|nr:hypothetical protein [Sphingobium yanoikuyae]